MQHCRLTCAAVMVHNVAKMLLGLFEVDIQTDKVLQARRFLGMQPCLAQRRHVMPLTSGPMACRLGCIAWADREQGDHFPASPPKARL